MKPSNLAGSSRLGILVAAQIPGREKPFPMQVLLDAIERAR